MARKIRILSIDGGGIRGIVPATILNYIELKIQELTQNPNARIADYFDLLAGSSTGGVLSMFYLMPNPNATSGPNSKYTAGEALQFYEQFGPRVFKHSSKFSWFGLRKIFDATAYSSKGLEAVYDHIFGNLHMYELLKPCLIGSYNLVHQQAVFFSSHESRVNMRDYRVADVARSTSAVPTVFPPARIKNLATGELMINLDGGVVANNPAMCAFAEARNGNFNAVEFPKTEDMLLLSLGTGSGKVKLPALAKAGSWGAEKWARVAPQIMLDASDQPVHYQLKQLFDQLPRPFNQQYKRIDVPLYHGAYAGELTDTAPSNITNLKEAAQKALEQALIDSEEQLGLDRFVELLIEPENSAHFYYSKPTSS